MEEKQCCPKFNPEPWQEKEITMQDKLFVTDRVLSFFHMPLNFGSVMARSMEKITSANAEPQEYLALSDECSLFGSDLYIHVTKDVPGCKMEKISGTFLTKAYEGGYKDMRNWIKDMEEYVKSKNKETKKLYFFYTTCPKCAKKYGKNYTVLLAQI